MNSLVNLGVYDKARLKSALSSINKTIVQEYGAEEDPQSWPHTEAQKLTQLIQTGPSQHPALKINCN